MKKLIYFLSVYFVIFIAFVILINIDHSPINSLMKDYEIVRYIIGLTLFFWYITFFVYLFQIAIITVGLIFHFIKEKQTIKNLLVPYGFIFTLKSYYKELK